MSSESVFDSEVVEITNLMSGIFLTRSRQVSDSMDMDAVQDEMDTEVQLRVYETPPLDCREALEGEDECIVCRVNCPNATLLGCNHTVVCSVCADQLFKTFMNCPLCRAAISSFRIDPAAKNKT